MSKHFFFSPERHPSASNLTSPSEGEYISVIANRPNDPDSQEVFVGITMDYSSADKGEAWAALDANELRDAIDKAVGERPDMEPASKPYRPIDRDRLLRHIEDVEASLTRRNERHERDQERIRELEADLIRARNAVEVQVQRVKEMAEFQTAREYLGLAWEAAHVPADGMIHEGEEYVYRCTDGSLILGRAEGSSDAPNRRLLDPRVEPTEEERRRKDYQDLGLADWEVELLMESER